MKVSFVIVNYNRSEELLLTLKKTKEVIHGIIGQFEIIVVDNASVDGSAEAVEAQHPDVILIVNPVNIGAPAWNLGFKRAKGDYFIILDDDSHIEYGLNDALNFLTEHDDIGVLALNITGGPYQTDKWINLEETVGFIGCGAILKKTLFEKIGGYADWMFLYVNEWEYGLRCLNAGYKVVFFEKCRVIHRASDINRTNKRLRVFVTMHELGIVYKYFSVSRSRYLFRVMINNLKNLKHGEIKYAYYNILGLVEFLRLRRKLSYTPVSKEAQNFWAQHFETTKKSAFGFVFERFFKKLK